MLKERGTGSFIPSYRMKQTITCPVENCYAFLDRKFGFIPKPFCLRSSCEINRKAFESKRSRLRYPLVEKALCALTHVASQIAPSPVITSFASGGASNKKKCTVFSITVPSRRNRKSVLPIGATSFSPSRPVSSLISRTAVSSNVSTFS